MNSLQKHLKGENEISAMNRLTEAGIISDNCVLAADVAEVDCERAIWFLRGGV